MSQTQTKIVTKTVTKPKTTTTNNTVNSDVTKVEKPKPVAKPPAKAGAAKTVLKPGTVKIAKKPEMVKSVEVKKRKVRPKRPEKIMTDITEFDPDKLEVKTCVIEEYTTGSDKNKKTNTSYISDIVYVENGKEHDLKFITPKQVAYGPNYTYPFPNTKESGVPPDGAQICIPLTSLETLEEPTEKEQAFKLIFDTVWEKALKRGREDALLGDECPFPRTVKDRFMTINMENENELREAIKVPYDYPKDKDNKNRFDTSKPRRTYIKLLKRKTKTGGLDITSRFYLPGDKEANPMNFEGKMGMLEAMVQVKDVYWGSFGTAPYVGSIRFAIPEANFTPIQSGYNNVRHMPPNTDPIVEEEEETKEKETDVSDIEINDKSLGEDLLSPEEGE